MTWINIYCISVFLKHNMFSCSLFLTAGDEGVGGGEGGGEAGEGCGRFGELVQCSGWYQQRWRPHHHLTIKTEDCFMSQSQKEYLP